MMQPHRAAHVRALILCAFAVVSASANAAFPERPIRWIVPGAAGSGVDASARLMANEISTILGQQIVVDNRTGAGGAVGIEITAKATPDGYVMASGNSTNICMNRTARLNMPYDVDRDLKAVIQTHFQPNVLIVSQSLPVSNVKELVEYAKKNPGKLLYSSSGNGSSLHFAGALFALMTGTEINHVPYASVPVAMNDLFGGRVPLNFGNMSAVAPLVKTGKVKGLAVTSARRSSVMPELPTIAESGLPGYEIVAWGGIVVPAGTPQPIVNQMNAAVNKALKAPGMKEKMENLGLEIVGGSAAEFGTFIRKEYAKWSEVAKKIGIKPE